MKPKAVGFYWTLPVPWIERPFIDLPENPEEAAEHSLTIRYQMELVRRYANAEGFELVKEGVYLELEPDRAGKQGRLKSGPDDATPTTLRKLTEFCRSEQATLLYVDFSREIGWRSHMVMDDWGGKHGIRSRPVPISSAVFNVNGKPFDPRQHFQNWRAKQKAWSAAKGERRALALKKAEELAQQGLTRSQIASRLNEDGIRSPTGKAWSGENVRKLLSSA